MSKKNKIILATVVAMAAMIGIFILFLTGVLKVPSKNIQITTTVKVEDGVATPGQIERELIIKNTDTYSMHVEWEAEKPGLLTGCWIINEKGETVKRFAAGSVTMTTNELELEKGTYTLQLFFLTSTEEEIAFFRRAGMTEEEMKIAFQNKPVYEYAQNGTWDMTYEFRWVQKDIPYKVGMMLGLLFGLILAVLLVTLTKKGEDVKCKYDERQELIRGRGFKYAFFSMLLCGLAVVVLESLGMLSEWLVTNKMGIVCILGMTVNICYCIWQDAYFALNENRTPILIILFIGGVVNLFLGILGLGEIGQVHSSSYAMYQPFWGLNLLVGIMFVILAGTMILKKVLKDGKDE